MNMYIIGKDVVNDAMYSSKSTNTRVVVTHFIIQDNLLSNYTVPYQNARSQRKIVFPHSRIISNA